MNDKTRCKISQSNIWDMHRLFAEKGISTTASWADLNFDNEVTFFTIPLMETKGKKVKYSYLVGLCDIKKRGWLFDFPISKINLIDCGDVSIQTGCTEINKILYNEWIFYNGVSFEKPKYLLPFICIYGNKQKELKIGDRVWVVRKLKQDVKRGCVSCIFNGRVDKVKRFRINLADGNSVVRKEKDVFTTEEQAENYYGGGKV